MKSFQLRLSVKSSISQGTNTCGYPMVALTDVESKRKYISIGGGYSLLAVVFREWLEETFKDRLISLSKDKLKNSSIYTDGTFQGGVSVEKMVDIAAKMGLVITSLTNPRGSTLGFFVEDVNQIR